MDSNLSAVPITAQELEAFSEQATRYISAVRWKEKAVAQDLAGGVPQWRESSIVDNPTGELSVLKSARRVSKDPMLLCEEVNHVLLVLRQGLRLGMHIGALYTKFSGLDQLITLNSKGSLSEQQKTEFRSKYYSASAITLFVTAYYIVRDLNSYKPQDVGKIQIDFRGLPDLYFQDPVRALECMIYYYAAYLDRSGVVNSAFEFTKLSLLYFEKIIDQIKLREASLQYLEPFTGQTYKLEGTEFTIHGFDVEMEGTEASVEFNRVELGEIVGNREAKHDARRLASRLLCYDFESQRNPMLDLGGFTSVTLGYGEPGTGKSLLIAALATMLHDYCKMIDVPFLFWPMPDTVVSTYQGGSAERMMSWMKVLKDPSKIIFAPIDDAENNLEDRTREGVSAGVREVIAVFLRNTEGAYAINRGNSIIQLFTNIPDQIDKAVLSRINNRSYIGGARTLEDFLDQDYLWFQRYEEIAPNFVGMKKPETYNYLSSQALLKSLSEAGTQCKVPSNEKLREIFEGVSKDCTKDEHVFFGSLFMQVKKAFPLFTSRDLRNIQRAIDSRVMDFDLPGMWFEKPDEFFRKNYNVKRDMLLDLMKANMKGLSFADIRLQESIRYLDNMVQIVEGGKERKIEGLVENYGIQSEAQKRFKERL